MRKIFSALFAALFFACSSTHGAKQTKNPADDFSIDNLHHWDPLSQQETKDEGSSSQRVSSFSNIRDAVKQYLSLRGANEPSADIPSNSFTLNPPSFPAPQLSSNVVQLNSRFQSQQQLPQSNLDSQFESISNLKSNQNFGINDKFTILSVKNQPQNFPTNQFTADYPNQNVPVHQSQFLVTNQPYQQQVPTLPQSITSQTYTQSTPQFLNSAQIPSNTPSQQYTLNQATPQQPPAVTPEGTLKDPSKIGFNDFISFLQAQEMATGDAKPAENAQEKAPPEPMKDDMHDISKYLLTDTDEFKIARDSNGNPILLSTVEANGGHVPAGRTEEIQFPAVGISPQVSHYLTASSELKDQKIPVYNNGKFNISNSAVILQGSASNDFLNHQSYHFGVDGVRQNVPTTANVLALRPQGEFGASEENYDANKPFFEKRPPIATDFSPTNNPGRNHFLGKGPSTSQAGEHGPQVDLYPKEITRQRPHYLSTPGVAISHSNTDHFLSKRPLTYSFDQPTTVSGHQGPTLGSSEAPKNSYTSNYYTNPSTVSEGEHPKRDTSSETQNFFTNLSPSDYKALVNFLSTTAPKVTPESLHIKVSTETKNENSPAEYNFVNNLRQSLTTTTSEFATTPFQSSSSFETTPSQKYTTLFQTSPVSDVKTTFPSSQFSSTRPPTSLSTAYQTSSSPSLSSRSTLQSYSTSSISTPSSAQFSSFPPTSIATFLSSNFPSSELTSRPISTKTTPTTSSPPSPSKPEEQFSVTYQSSSYSPSSPLTTKSMSPPTTSLRTTPSVPEPTINPFPTPRPYSDEDESNLPPYNPYPNPPSPISVPNLNDRPSYSYFSAPPSVTKFPQLHDRPPTRPSNSWLENNYLAKPLIPQDSYLYPKPGHNAKPQFIPNRPNDFVKPAPQDHHYNKPPQNQFFDSHPNYVSSQNHNRPSSNLYNSYGQPISSDQSSGSAHPFSQSFHYGSNNQQQTVANQHDIPAPSPILAPQTETVKLSTTTPVPPAKEISLSQNYHQYEVKPWGPPPNYYRPQQTQNGGNNPAENNYYLWKPASEDVASEDNFGIFQPPTQTSTPTSPPRTTEASRPTTTLRAQLTRPPQQKPNYAGYGTQNHESLTLFDSFPFKEQGPNYYPRPQGHYGSNLNDIAPEKTSNQPHQSYYSRPRPQGVPSNDAPPQLGTPYNVWRPQGPSTDLSELSRPSGTLNDGKESRPLPGYYLYQSPDLHQPPSRPSGTLSDEKELRPSPGYYLSQSPDLSLPPSRPSGTLSDEKESRPSPGYYVYGGAGPNNKPPQENSPPEREHDARPAQYLPPYGLQLQSDEPSLAAENAGKLPFDAGELQTVTLPGDNCSATFMVREDRQSVLRVQAQPGGTAECSLTFVAPRPAKLALQLLGLSLPRADGGNDKSSGSGDCATTAVQVFSQKDGRNLLISEFCGSVEASAALLTEGQTALITIKAQNGAQRAGLTVLAFLW